MPTKPFFNPWMVSKIILWVMVIGGATVMLRRRGVSPRRRTVFVAVGTLVFGFVYGFLVKGANPNPVLSLRSVLGALLSGRSLVPLTAILLVLLLLMVAVSNKSICGWGCQLGLLQELLYRIPAPKWRPPFWLTNTVRVAAFLALVSGLALAGVDWVKGADPFRLFSTEVGLGAAALGGLVLIASVFIYRPWCQFLCPFGLVGWLVEQVSFLRPRVNWDRCLGCKFCVKACPTGAMADF